jgi:hypothetical protein
MHLNGLMAKKRGKATSYARAVASGLHAPGSKLNKGRLEHGWDERGFEGMEIVDDVHEDTHKGASQLLVSSSLDIMGCLDRVNCSETGRWESRIGTGEAYANRA